MAITATQFPEKVSMCNRQPVQVRLTSNLPVAELLLNVLQITLLGTPQAGQKLYFSYGDFSTQLTFAVDTQEAQTLSLRNGLSDEDYHNLVAQELAAQVDIFLMFTVNSIGSLVRVVPRGNATLTFTYYTDAPILVETLTAGSDSYVAPPGITLVNEIYDPTTGAFTTIIPHQLPVFVPFEPVVIDLRNDFELEYETPLASSIAAGANYVHHCTRNWTRYRLRYAESVGRPPITQPLIEHPEELIAFHGSRSFLNQFAQFWQFWESGGRFQTSLLSPQRVTPQQPNWLYWIGRQDGRTLQMRARIERESGAEEIRNLGQFEETLGELVALSTGMRQLGIPEEDPDRVVGYTFYLAQVGAQGGGQLISQEFGYEVSYDCEDWERYLLVGNSLGGMDVVRTTGKFQITSDSTTKTARRSVTAETIATSHGEDFHYQRQQRISYAGSVGHVSRIDIVRLQSLLVSESVKLIDTAQQRFIPILVEAGSVTLTKDANDLDSLTFRFSLAYEDHAIDDLPKLL